jgi:hypothetical protein
MREYRNAWKNTLSGIDIFTLSQLRQSSIGPPSGIRVSRELNTERPTLVFFLAPTKPLQSYREASPHRRYSGRDEIDGVYLPPLERSLQLCT